MSSIPSHNPSSLKLSGGRKLFLGFMVVAPVLGYVVLKRRQYTLQQEQKSVEEQGRRNWVLEQKEKASKGEGDLAVSVGRSGGGV
jgi:hypothetical protein